jgi:adenosylmethionine-8-amino-7-oxononanoate aminotransferase
VAELCVQIGKMLEPIAAMPRVSEIRRRGLMVGIELAGFDVSERAGHQVTLAARRRGAIVRPLGDVIVLMPPLAISESELQKLIEIVGESIAEVCAGVPEQEPKVSRAKVRV